MDLRDGDKILILRKTEKSDVWVAILAVVMVLMLVSMIIGAVSDWLMQLLMPYHWFASSRAWVGSVVVSADHALTNLWVWLAALPFSSWDTESDTKRAGLNFLLQSVGVIAFIAALCLLFRGWLGSWPLWSKVLYAVAGAVVFNHFMDWQEKVTCPDGGFWCKLFGEDKTPVWMMPFVLCVWVLPVIAFFCMFEDSVKERLEDGEKIGLMRLALARLVSRLMSRFTGDNSGEPQEKPPFGESSAAGSDETGGLL